MFTLKTLFDNFIHIYDICCSFFPPIIFSRPPHNTSHFSPQQVPLLFSSFFHWDFWHKHGWGYLLDYEQHTSACGYTTEENDSPRLNRHWLSIATQDRMNLMRPSSSHDEMLMNPIMCKRLLIYIGIHVLSLSDYEHFCIEHHWYFHHLLNMVHIFRNILM